MTPRTRFGLLIAALLVIGVAVGGLFAIRAALNTSPFTADGCTVGRYDLDTGQAAVASTMVGVVARRELPERAAVLVLAAGLQESKLRNLASGEGDRDSVGVLQQRPSQDWGKVDGQPDSISDRARRLADVRFATGAFLDALLTKVPDWQHTDLADAIQTVQISADGSAYTQHEGEAQALSHALMGTLPAGITCSFHKPTAVAPVATVVTQVVRDLPVAAPTTAQLTVRVPGARWQTAAWFVANADRLGIDKVAYNGKQWTRAKGWKSANASATSVVATMYQK